MAEQDDKKPAEIIPLPVSNVTQLDKQRVKRLQTKGHYFFLLEEFELLRIKFIHEPLDKREALRFVTLCKYFMQNGHSESLKLMCKYMYDRYIAAYGL